MTGANDGTRTLLESILPNEVLAALNDWKKQVETPVLIGGLALSYYVKPRYTQDIDYLFLEPDAIPAEVPGFKRVRPHAFVHKETHVEIEVLTPDTVNVSRELAEKVEDSATVSDGVRIASPAGLVALKLQRATMKDQGDIVELIKTGQVDMDGWPISEDQLVLYRHLQEVARKEMAA